MIPMHISLEGSYPDLYRFIVDNLDKATSQEEADKVEFED